MAPRADYLLNVCSVQAPHPAKNQSLLKAWGQHVHCGGNGALSMRNQEVVFEEILNNFFEGDLFIMQRRVPRLFWY